MIKKVYNSLFIILLLLSSFLLVIPETKAVSIADFRKNLASLKEEKRQNEENSKATQEKIAAAKKEMQNIERDIANATNDITRTEAEIIKLEEEIEKKEQEIKDLVVFLQLSNSENFYLKYIFGAEDFTDLIYRVSVIQQLTTKNDSLVDEMNDLIKENEKKIKSLEGKKKQLNELNQKVLVQIQKLGKESNSYFEEGANIDERIEAAEEQIQFYVDEGCGENC